jgi:hypothetical protein
MKFACIHKFLFLIVIIYHAKSKASYIILKNVKKQQQ